MNEMNLSNPGDEYIATEADQPDPVRVQQVNLLEVEVGTTVEIKTAYNFRYRITVLHNRRTVRDGDGAPLGSFRIKGVVVQSNNKYFQTHGETDPMEINPSDQMVDQTCVVGHT